MIVHGRQIFSDPVTYISPTYIYVAHIRMNSFSNQDIKIASHLGSLNTKSFQSMVHSIYQMSNAVEIAHYGNQISNKIKFYDCYM